MINLPYKFYNSTSLSHIVQLTVRDGMKASTAKYKNIYQLYFIPLASVFPPLKDQFAVLF